MLSTAIVLLRLQRSSFLQIQSSIFKFPDIPSTHPSLKKIDPFTQVLVELEMEEGQAVNPCASKTKKNYFTKVSLNRYLKWMLIEARGNFFTTNNLDFSLTPSCHSTSCIWIFTGCFGTIIFISIFHTRTRKTFITIQGYTYLKVTR